MKLRRVGWLNFLLGVFIFIWDDAFQLLNPINGVTDSQWCLRLLFWMAFNSQCVLSDDLDFCLLYKSCVSRKQPRFVITIEEILFHIFFNHWYFFVIVFFYSNVRLCFELVFFYTIPFMCCFFFLSSTQLRGYQISSLVVCSRRVYKNCWTRLLFLYCLWVFLLWFFFAFVSFFEILYVSQ